MNPQWIATYIVLPALSLSLVLGMVRLVRGPSVADRVVALDLLGVLGVGLTVILAVLSGYAPLLDVGLVVAIVSFIGTVAFARYLERSA